MWATGCNLRHLDYSAESSPENAPLRKRLGSKDLKCESCYPLWDSHHSFLICLFSTYLSILFFFPLVFCVRGSFFQLQCSIPYHGCCLHPGLKKMPHNQRNLFFKHILQLLCPRHIILKLLSITLSFFGSALASHFIHRWACTHHISLQILSFPMSIPITWRLKIGLLLHFQYKYSI